MSAPASDTNALQLGPELTIAYAAAHRETLLQALATRPDELKLDLSGVTDFDSAGVQLLQSAARSLAQRGQHLQVIASSETVQQGLAVFGLHALGKAAAASAHVADAAGH